MNALSFALPSLRTYNAQPPAAPAAQPPAAEKEAPPPPEPGNEPPPLKPGELGGSSVPSNPTQKKIDFLPPQTTTITRTFERPVLHPESLGRIPADYYQPVWGNPWPHFGSSIYYPIGGGFGGGQVDVYRDVPEYNADGTAKKRTVTETLTESTYDQKKRTIGFGIAAAVGGAAAAAGVSALKGAGAGPIGMVIGGLLGAAAGATIGFKSAEGDKVYEQWFTEGIHHPSLIGYNQWMTADYRTEYDRVVHHNPDGTTREELVPRSVLQGWWVRFDPEIRWRRVGEYDYPTLQHTAKIGPVGGTFMAIGAGLLAGGAAGLVATMF